MKPKKKKKEKGFTLIELIATIGIIGIILGITGILFTNIINNSTNTTETLSINNILKASKTYVEEYQTEISWQQNNDNKKYTCVTINELVNKNLLKQEILSKELPADNIIVTKNENNTTTEKFDENNVNSICAANFVPIPTNDLCNSLTYNGNEQILTKDVNNPNFYFSNNTGINAGTYQVTATLNSQDYTWKDGTTEEKTITCSIKKAEPQLLLTPNSSNTNTVGTIKESTINSNTSGTLTVKSSNNEYFKAFIKDNLTTIAKNGTQTLLIEFLSSKESVGYITVTITPNDLNNYYSTSTIFTIDKINTIEIEKPKCKNNNLKYNGKEQELVDPVTGISFYNYKATEIGNHKVIAKLKYGYIWKENKGTEDITLICPINAQITYDKNGGTGTNFSEIVQYEADYITKDNTLISFTNKNYTFKGWNEKADGKGTDWTSKIGKKWQWTYKQNVTLYAQWEPNTYTITLDKKGGTGGTDGPIYQKYNTGWYSDPNTIEDNEIEKIKPPAKEGYTFDGYYYTNTKGTELKIIDSSGNIVTTEKIFTTSHTLYAKWTAKTYTVTFNPNGGTVTTTSKTVTYANTYGTLPTPTWDHHTFLGWYTAEKGGTKITSSTKVAITANQTLYAQWSENVYTITLKKDNCGTNGTSTFYLKYGIGFYSNSTATTSITKITPPSKIGSKFLGYYYTNSNGTESKVIKEDGTFNFSNTGFTGNRELYAKCEATKVNIKYAVGTGGTVRTTTTTKEGTTYTWSSNSTTGIVSRTKDSTAKDIFHSYNYGDGSTTVNLNNYNNENYLYISRTGYTGKSGAQWKCTGGDCTSNTEYSHSTDYTTADICNASYDHCTAIVTVNWTPKTYTVTLNNQSATSAGTSSLYGTYNAGVYLDSAKSKLMSTGANPITKPTKTGYTFGGYYTSTGGTGTQMINASGNITSNFTKTKYSTNVTLYAKWTSNSYKISYNLNKGTLGTYKPESGTYGSNVRISNPTKTVTVTGNANGTGATIGSATSGSQTFAGWTATGLNTSTAKYGTNSATVTTTWNGTTKVTAQYFKNLTSTKDATVTMTANWTAKAFNLPTVTKNGYTCTWNTKSDGSGTSYNSGASYTPSTTSATAITVYARCTIKTYNVTINSNNTTYGTVSTTTIKVNHGTTYSTSGSTLTFSNNSKSTAKTKSTPGYTTRFSNWSKTSGTITNATTITANFARTENYLTVNYYSNYATSSFSGATNTVGADKNVLVRTTKHYYSESNTDGLWNYSTVGSSTYLGRTGYTATGNWGTSTSGGTIVGQNTGFATGQAMAEAFGKSLKTGNASVNIYPQWTANKLTINYYSNYATSAFPGALNTVGADKNVIVRVWETDYTYQTTDNLHNYANSSDGTYLARSGYSATGYWGSTTSGGTTLHQDTNFKSAAELASKFGKNLGTGNVVLNLYAQWKQSVMYPCRSTSPSSFIAGQTGLLNKPHNDDGSSSYQYITIKSATPVKILGETGNYYIVETTDETVIASGNKWYDGIDTNGDGIKEGAWGDTYKRGYMFKACLWSTPPSNSYGWCTQSQCQESHYK